MKLVITLLLHGHYFAAHTPVPRKAVSRVNEVKSQWVTQAIIRENPITLKTTMAIPSTQAIMKPLIFCKYINGLKENFNLREAGFKEAQEGFHVTNQ